MRKADFVFQRRCFFILTHLLLYETQSYPTREYCSHVMVRSFVYRFFSSWPGSTEDSLVDQWSLPDLETAATSSSPNSCFTISPLPPCSQMPQHGRGQLSQAPSWLLALNAWNALKWQRASNSSWSGSPTHCLLVVQVIIQKYEDEG